MIMLTIAIYGCEIFMCKFWFQGEAPSTRGGGSYPIQGAEAASERGNISSCPGFLGVSLVVSQPNIWSSDPFGDTYIASPDGIFV